jgi:polysaccharide export outer membrane protein
MATMLQIIFKGERANHRRIQPISRLAPLFVLCLALFQLLAGSTAHAQFSGPSLSASTPVNQPVVLTTDPAVLYPQDREMHLGPGDIITVHIYGSLDYSPQATISLDGSAQLPLAGTIHVEGLTLHEAERKIADELIRAGMYRDPQVSIQLNESPHQVATLSGEVRGLVPILGQRRLFDVIAGAGGFPATASHVVTIHRPGVDQPIVIDLGTDPAKSERANVPIFAGDTIVTARTGVVYVLGAFKIQGSVPLQQNSPLTLMQVAALSGGPGFEAKYGDLRLVRTIGLERKIVHVDIKRVMNGKDPDPVLQVDDIVFLPSSRIKAAIKQGGVGTLLGIVSLLVVTTQR